jgi:hypothetical protein
LLACPFDPVVAVLPCCPLAPLFELSCTVTSENLTTISSTCRLPLGVEFPVDAGGAALPLAASLLWLGVLAAVLLAVLGVVAAAVLAALDAFEAVDAACVTSCASAWN